MKLLIMVVLLTFSLANAGQTYKLSPGQTLPLANGSVVVCQGVASVPTGGTCKPNNPSDSNAVNNCNLVLKNQKGCTSSPMSFYCHWEAGGTCMPNNPNDSNAVNNCNLTLKDQQRCSSMPFNMYCHWVE